MNNSATFPLPQTNNQTETFSRRFLAYQKDKSKRGRSLALANQLENLKKNPDYKDFSPQLIEAISRIRESGRETEESKTAKVLRVLKEFPSTLEELIEDTGISKKELILVLKSLTLQNVIAEKQQRRWQELGEHYTSFYELIETVPA